MNLVAMQIKLLRTVAVGFLVVALLSSSPRLFFIRSYRALADPMGPQARKLLLAAPERLILI